MRVLTVVGARPQFIKAAPVSHSFEKSGIEEILVHTGQHFDAAMSEVFFSDLNIPTPKHHLILLWLDSCHTPRYGYYLGSLFKLLVSPPVGHISSLGGSLGSSPHAASRSSQSSLLPHRGSR